MRSKCSDVDAYPISSPPAGLPSWWFDYSQRTLEPGFDLAADGTESDNVNCGYPSYLVALHWCSQTSSDFQSLGSLRAQKALTRGPDVSVCGHTLAPTSSRRLAIASLEVASDGQTLPFMRPMVSAMDEQLNVIATPDCSDLLRRVRFTSSLDPRVAAAAAPALLWDNEPWGVRELADEQKYQELKVPRCGTLQRVSWWNRGCVTALEQLGDARDPTVPWTPVTGEFMDAPSGPGSCLVRERRALVPHCPTSMLCTAGGQCVPESSGPSPTVVILDTP